LVVRSIIRDTHIAAGGRIGWQPVAPESGGGPGGLLPAKDQVGTQTLFLAMNRGDRETKRAIAYRLEGSRLERITLDAATAPIVQTLSGHVRRWKIERSGDLVRIEMELAINRYTRGFITQYAFATRVGVGQIANLSYREEQNREP
jgi:hypothetical protein